MGAFIDARTVPSDTVVRADLAIIGGGPAGIALAMALANTRLKIVLLESGGHQSDTANQSLNRASVTGLPYPALDTFRDRFFGGSSNHWDGWCRPLDALDFEPRDWLGFSGWPVTKKELDRTFVKAHMLCEAGTLYYDAAGAMMTKLAPALPLGTGSLTTRWYQFSRMRGGPRPTRFGDRYVQDLKKQARLTVYLNASVTRLGLNASGKRIAVLDAATLTGRKFTVKPKAVVLAAGAIETARLLLASNDVRPAGIGNSHDLVGRFFADHPLIGSAATLVLFGGAPAPYYLRPQRRRGAVLQAGLILSEASRRTHMVTDSSIIPGDPAELDAFGKAAVTATASALGTGATRAAVYALGGSIELSPDPGRRITLTRQRDALGLPVPKLHMRIAGSDFDQFRETLKELGRQLLSARIGMVHLNRDSGEDWRQGLNWCGHQMGTARMSADPKQGVVNADLKVHGVANLYLAGSAVFPTYGTAPPTVPLIALALRLASHLKKVLR